MSLMGTTAVVIAVDTGTVVDRVVITGITEELADTAATTVAADITGRTAITAAETDIAAGPELELAVMEGMEAVGTTVARALAQVAAPGAMEGTEAADTAEAPGQGQAPPPARPRTPAARMPRGAIPIAPRPGHLPRQKHTQAAPRDVTTQWLSANQPVHGSGRHAAMSAAPDNYP